MLMMMMKMLLLLLLLLMMMTPTPYIDLGCLATTSLELLSLLEPLLYVLGSFRNRIGTVLGQSDSFCTFCYSCEVVVIRFGTVLGPSSSGLGVSPTTSPAERPERRGGISERSTRRFQRRLVGGGRRGRRRAAGVGLRAYGLYSVYCVCKHIPRGAK